jgi:predicted PurR-regulated permease PerM
MNANHKELLSILVTSAILFATVMIMYPFLSSMAWAVVLGITTYPLYLKWKKCFGKFQQVSAASFSFVLFLLLLLPLSYVVTILVSETQIFIGFLQNINENGITAPAWIAHLPWYGQEISKYWEQHFSNPGDIKSFLKNLHLSLTHTSYVAKQVGTIFAHASFKLGFTFLTLFFVYRDGEKLLKQIAKVGPNCFGDRWSRYSDQLPSALRATVNGTILVGLGVGFLMGICYKLLGITAPTLLGFITAFCAMVPFVVPIVLFFISLSLIAHGAFWSAIIVIAWGTLVMFVADHFIKPVLIGGAIELPFLAVLFGILGGVETLGILGLFLGPIIMVLFVTLWSESQDK